MLSCIKSIVLTNVDEFLLAEEDMYKERERERDQCPSLNNTNVC